MRKLLDPFSKILVFIMMLEPCQNLFPPLGSWCYYALSAFWYQIPNVSFIPIISQSEFTWGISEVFLLLPFITLAKSQNGLLPFFFFLLRWSWWVYSCLTIHQVPGKLSHPITPDCLHLHSVNSRSAWALRTLLEWRYSKLGPPEKGYTVPHSSTNKNHNKVIIHQHYGVCMQTMQGQTKPI